MKKRIKVFGITGTKESGRKTVGGFLADWHNERGFDARTYETWSRQVGKAILEGTRFSVHVFYHVANDAEVNEMREAFGKDFLMIYLNCPEYQRMQFSKVKTFQPSKVSAVLCDRILVNDACTSILKTKAGIAAMAAWAGEKP